jgi:hypothetical protein
MNDAEDIAIAAVSGAVAKGQSRHEQYAIARKILRGAAAALASLGSSDHASAEAACLARTYAGRVRRVKR